MVVVKQLKDKSGTNLQPNVPDKVGYPEDSRTSLTWGYNNTISEDGWVIIRASTYSGSNINLSVNGAVQLEFMNNGLQSYSVFLTRMYPVKKGDVVKATGGSDTKEIYSIKIRTETNGGGFKQSLNRIIQSLRQTLYTFLNKEVCV